jgi:plastocyanin
MLPAILSILLAAPGISVTGRIDGTVTVTEKGRPRADASGIVVWVDGAHGGDGRKRELPRMTSLHKKFVPRVVAVEAGEAVAFPNQDAIFHNVFSVSGENRFDLGLYRQGKSREKAFAAPGLVRVYCNIHPQMVGYVRVVDSSFYAVTGPDGRFSFDGVPAGERTVKAWSEEGGEFSATALVRPGSPAKAALAVDTSGFRSEPHKNKYGKDYPPPPADEERY